MPGPTLLKSLYDSHKPYRRTSEGDDTADGEGYARGLLQDIRLDNEEYESLRARLRLTRAEMSVAARTAANKTARWGRGQFRKAVGARLNLQTKDLNRAIDFLSARPPSVYAAVVITRYPLPLRAYKPKQTKQGLVVQFSRIGAGILFRDAFLGEMPFGSKFRDTDGTSTQAVRRAKHLPTEGINARTKFRLVKYKTGPRASKQTKWGTGVYRQKLGVTPRGVVWSLTLDKLYGPSVISQFYNKNELTDLARTSMGDLQRKFLETLRSQARWVLSGKGGVADLVNDADERLPEGD